MSDLRSEITRRPLRIMFDGVVALGPGHPESGDLDGPFFAVMPRSTRRLSDRTQRLKRQSAAGGDMARGSGVDEKPQYIPMHVPTIFTLMKPTDDSRPPDQVLQHSPLHPRWYLWHPLRERLEFRFDGDGTPGPLQYHRGAKVPFPEHGGGALAQGALTFHAIEQAPDMRRIWPGRGLLVDGLLSRDAPVSDLVMTQVLVPRGIVAASGVLEKGDSLDVVFDPVRGLGQHDSLVPNVAVIADASTIEIVSYSLDTGEQLDSIRFETGNGGEIWLSNGDPSDVEIDMEKLARQIAERRAEQGESEVAGELKVLLQSVDGGGSDAAWLDLRAVGKIFHHGNDVVHQGIAHDHHRAGNVDLDFELFYTIMKNGALARDGKGLPVPRRPRNDDEFNGPNCYVTICDTEDKLSLKSQS